MDDVIMYNFMTIKIAKSRLPINVHIVDTCDETNLFKEINTTFGCDPMTNLAVARLEG